MELFPALQLHFVQEYARGSPELLDESAWFPQGPRWMGLARRPKNAKGALDEEPLPLATEEEKPEVIDVLYP